jgi:outer membrane lipoprotein-sorting protein
MQQSVCRVGCAHRLRWWAQPTLQSLCRLLPLAVCALMLTGWAGTWDTLQRESEKLTSVSARFTQSKNMRILSRPLLSTGSFYFKAPDSVRFVYDTPVKSILLMHEGSVKRYTQGAEGLIEDSSAALQSMNVMLQEIALWSRGRFRESPGFSAELKAGDAPAILLTPRDEGLAKIITAIEIALAPERPGAISTITIREGEGGTTVMQFSDVELNRALADSLFRRP